VVYTIGNLLPQAMNFILLPVYTKYLEPSEFGIIGSMQVLQYFFIFVFTFCLEKSIVRLYWEYTTEESRKKFLGTIASVVFLNVLFWSSILILFHHYVNFVFTSVTFFPYYFYSIIITAFMAIAFIPLNFLILKERTKTYFFITTLQIVSTTLLILFFVIIQRRQAEGILMGRVIGSAVVFPFYILIAKKNFIFKINWAALKKGLHFSLPIVPTMIIAWILGQMDRIFIEKYFSLTSVGLYSISRQIANVLGILASAFGMAYGPMFFRLINSKENNYKEKIFKINNIYILGMIILFASISLLCKDLFYYFLNARYFDAYRFIPLLSFGVLINSISGIILNYYFQQSHKMKENMYIAIIVASVYIIISLIIIKDMGAFGAAITNAFISTLLFTISYLYTRKRCFFINIDWRTIIPVLVFYLLAIIFFVYIFDKISIVFLVIKIILIGISGVYFLRKKVQLSYLIQLKTN